MASLLGGTPISRAEQEANDQHNPLMVLAVLAFLGLFIYLFTYAPKALGLPMPSSVGQTLGLSYQFDDDGNIDTSLYIPFTFRFNNDDERFALFTGVGLAFLLAYFLPLKYKQGSLVFSSLVIIAVLYGLAGVAGLLCAHTLVYLVLHPVARYRQWIAGLPGFFGVWAFFPYETLSLSVFGLPFIAASLSILVYRYGILKLFQNSIAAKWLRILLIQSALITILIGAVLEGIYGQTWELVLGVLLFFWHWERLFMYHIDFQDGKIPSTISLMTYLSVFLTPGQIANWSWGVTIGQGYAYTVNNFLVEDKNELVRSGLQLWAVALVYFLFGAWAHGHLLDFLNGQGVSVYSRIEPMSADFISGEKISTVTVLLTTLIALMKWTLSWGGVMHFKVGLWRVCGYKIDPYFNYPWLSTNLVTLWARFTFHYREFLVRAFYYPIFFKYFKRHTHLRIFTATMAAACFGNLVWGHMTEATFYYGLEFNNIYESLQQWPYFVLLGLGITLCEFWLLHKKKSARKVWTFDKDIGWDFLSAYATLQYYALIHIFVYTTPEATLADNFSLFLIGLGFHF
ncbi:MAG: hypothetical protein HOH38_07505 [Nitrospinaceae bacterium]|nr:hypothetical protein [Nitrospinaceae bacterium]